jgi:hypothetical protein
MADAEHCNFEAPDPAKQVDTSKSLIHECVPPPGSPEAAAATPPPPPDARSTGEKLLDWAATKLYGPEDTQTTRDQALATQKAEHAAFMSRLEMKEPDQKAMREAGTQFYSAIASRPDLFPPNDASLRTNAYLTWLNGYNQLKHIPQPSQPLTAERLDFVHSFGWNHSADNPDAFLKENPDFSLVYTVRHRQTSDLQN